MVRWALLGGLAWLIGVVPVVAGEVTALRSSPEGEATRVVIETRTPTAHRLFTLTNPDRVVVDLEAVSVPEKFSP
ncbi:MAG: AMIN domain-containing protein, partial [Pseudomonadota bacterium]|nr:AMIN domain-containing protein [Pseudomonadota bacterium]